MTRSWWAKNRCQVQGEQRETKGASGATAYTRGSEGLAPCMPSRHWCGPWRRSLVGAAGAHKTLQRTANITTQRCYEAAAVATKTNEPKTQHGCILDGNLNYHFCLPGTHGFAASKHPTWPLAPWPLRGPPWPKTTRRFVVRILPPPPPGSSQRKKPDDHKPTPEPNIRRSPE